MVALKNILISPPQLSHYDTPIKKHASLHQDGSIVQSDHISKNNKESFQPPKGEAATHQGSIAQDHQISESKPASGRAAHLKNNRSQEASRKQASLVSEDTRENASSSLRSILKKRPGFLQSVSPMDFKKRVTFSRFKEIATYSKKN